MSLLFCVSVFLLILLAPNPVSAHEVYVLTKEQFASGMQHPGFFSLAALQNPANISTFINVSIGVSIAIIISFVFRHTIYGLKIDQYLKRFSYLSPLIVRLTIAITFFAAALDNVFLGPEISLNAFPLASIIRICLFVMSFLVLFGFMTELAAVVGLIIFGLTFYLFGWYPLNYLNYLGELIVLLLFGSRAFSIDKKLFGKLNRFKNWQKYEPTIVRVFYGLALLNAAITVKVLHSILTQTVVNEYNLTQFHWLFPADPLLVALGAALAEITIAIFIIIGFQIRLTVLISLFYITLSLLFFQESVWPHLLLYGISLNLLINGGGPLTLDGFFDSLIKKIAKHHQRLGS